MESRKESRKVVSPEELFMPKQGRAEKDIPNRDMRNKETLNKYLSYLLSSKDYKDGKCI